MIPLHFHRGGGEARRAKLPKGLTPPQRLLLAEKTLCVPAWRGAVPLLRLCDEGEYANWQAALDREEAPTSHRRLLCLLVRPLPPIESAIVLPELLLAYAHITGDAALSLCCDRSVWLTPINEKENYYEI